MSRARVLREAGLLVSCATLVAACLTVACSGAVAATTDGAVTVTVTSSAVVVENTSGTSLTDVAVNLMPAGNSRPYFQLPFKMYNNEKKSFPLETFRSSDGTPFRPNAVKARSVKVTSKDVMGKEHASEIPFP